MMLWNCFTLLFIHYRPVPWLREEDWLCNFFENPAFSTSHCFSFFSFFLLYLSFFSLSAIHCLSHSDSFPSTAFLAPSVYPAFLWNVMIHRLWSLRAVSFKSMCLLSMTAEWYITSILCNFLGFIRCIYSPYNGENCSFLPSLETLSWKLLSGLGAGQH